MASEEDVSKLVLISAWNPDKIRLRAVKTG